MATHSDSLDFDRVCQFSDENASLGDQGDGYYVGFWVTVEGGQVTAVNEQWAP